MVIYDPEVGGIRFPTFEQELKRLDVMIDRYKKYLTRGYPRKSCLVQSFRDTHKSPDGMTIDKGPEGFYDLFGEALQAVQFVLLDLETHPLSAFADRLEQVDEVRVTDPYELLKIYLHPPKDATRSEPRIKAWRMWYEARRNLVIALQMMVMWMIDPRLEISTDVPVLGRLINERLFLDEIKYVWIVAELDVEACLRVRGMDEDPNNPCVWVFFSAEAAEAKKAELRERGASFQAMDQQECRVIQAPWGRFLIWNKSRPKTVGARLIKYYRSGCADDARGARLIAVAVMPAQGGPMRPATRQDVFQLTTYAKRHFWTTPLELHEDEEDKRSPHSSTAYWDITLSGYMLSERSERLVRRPLEQQWTSIADQISQRTVRGHEHHSYYRGKRVLGEVAGHWYGHIDGIDWTSQEVYAQLERQWYRGLKGVTYLSPCDRVRLKEMRNGNH